MIHDPLISVVIASYQHESFIVEAIQSILDQSFQDFEIIITDDGSSDNSVQKIKAIKDPRITLFEFEVNQGACAAMNNCIINARGKYIAVMNSDDFWVKDKLKKQIEFLSENKTISAVFSYAELCNEELSEVNHNTNSTIADIFNQKNRTSEEWLNKFFYEGNCLCHPSVLIKKSCYDELGLYDNRFRQLPDFDMWTRFCKKYSLHVLPEKLVKFRLLSGNKNASSPTISNQFRDRNERRLIMQSFFDNMEISTFKKAFSKQLNNKNFTSLDDFEIEKALLYFGTKHSIIGIESLFRLLGRKEFIHSLKENYGITYTEFHNLSQKVIAFEEEGMDIILQALFIKLKKYPKLKLAKIVTRKLINYFLNLFIKK